MKKQIKRLMALVLSVSMTFMVPGTAAFADEVQNADEVIELSGLSGTIFDDVNTGDWYESYVGYVLNKGIMTGKGENLFAPGEELCRAQFATVLYRIAGSPDVSYSAVFPDVPDGMFYTKPVLWASQDEVAVITGYEEGNFGPDDMITREQMATMLYRYAEYKGFIDSETDDTIPGEPDSEGEESEVTDPEIIETEETNAEESEIIAAELSELDKYPDAALVSGFAQDAMEWAVCAEIITGDNGTLNPQGTTNRAVCATMVQRFCEKFMPGELKDVDMSASCQRVSITQTSVEEGIFWIKAEGVKASMDIQKVQARVWCYGVNEDAGWYTLEKQPDGSYGTGGGVLYHGIHFGIYYADMYVMLSNGVRLYVGSANVQVDGSIGQIRVVNHVNNVYNQVGRDLYSCYMWVVNNVSYKRLPNPLEPPAGYTSAEWYALQAFDLGEGNCYCFAAAFYYLAKGLGYDAEFIQGRVKLRSGGYNLHGWVIINLDCASYICDPESTRDIGRYNFYMQPVNSPVMQYEW